MTTVTYTDCQTAQPRHRQRHGIVLNDQPTLGDCVGAGHPEVGHLPVTDNRSLCQFAQGQRPTDPTALVVDDDCQQPPAECLWFLLAWTFPSDPRAFGDPLVSMFSHARWIMLGIGSGQYIGGGNDDAHGSVTCRTR